MHFRENSARRLSFGLSGLPPDAAGNTSRAADFELRFQGDSEKAVANYAAELMASPHYGEHFGRQWLDATRYADSSGFANDYTRPNAWRYRDYVVRSFNNDKPYSDFVANSWPVMKLMPTIRKNELQRASYGWGHGNRHR